MRQLVLLSLILMVSCSAREGWVRVEGNKFVDPDGQELVFRGLCFSDPVKLIQYKDLYEKLEDTMDACQDVAKALDTIVMKNM